MSKNKKIKKYMFLTLSLNTLLTLPLIALSCKEKDTSIKDLKSDLLQELKKIESHSKYQEYLKTINTTEITKIKYDEIKKEIKNIIDQLRNKIKTVIGEISSPIKKDEYTAELSNANTYKELQELEKKVIEYKNKKIEKSKPNTNLNSKQKTPQNTEPSVSPGPMKPPTKSNPNDSSDSNSNQIMDKQKTKEERYSQLQKLVQEIPFPSTNAIAKKTLSNSIPSKDTITEEQFKEKEELFKKLYGLIDKKVKEISELNYPNKDSEANKYFKSELDKADTEDKIAKIIPQGWKDKIKSWNELSNKITERILRENVKTKLNNTYTINDSDKEHGEKHFLIELYNAYLESNFYNAINKMQNLNEEMKKELKTMFLKLNDSINGSVNINEKLNEIEVKLNEAIEANKVDIQLNQKSWGWSWSTDNDKDVSSNKNETNSDNLKSILKKPKNIDQAKYDKALNHISNILPLRNTIATILGLDDLSKLKGSSGDQKDKDWLVGKELLNDSIFKTDKLRETYYNGSHDALHIRQLEKYLFGANGDQENSKEELIKKLVGFIEEDNKNNSKKLEEFKKEILGKAKEFTSTYSKIPVNNEAKIKNATEKYLNTYLNAAYVRVELSINTINQEKQNTPKSSIPSDSQKRIDSNKDSSVTPPAQSNPNDNINNTGSNQKMDKQKTKEERYSELLKLVQEIPFPSTDAIAKKALSNSIPSKDTITEEQFKEKEELFKKLYGLIDKKIKEISELNYPNKDSQANKYFKSELNKADTEEKINKIIPNNWKTKVELWNKLTNKVSIRLRTKVQEILNKTYINNDTDQEHGEKHFLIELYNAYLEANYYHAIDKMQNLDDNKKKIHKNKLHKLNTNETINIEEKLKDVDTKLHEAIEANRVNIKKDQGTWGESWSTDDVKNDPSNMENETNSDNLKSILKKPDNIDQAKYDKALNHISNILPLRNTIATILGLDDLDKLKGSSDGQNNQPWLVGKEILKKEVFSDHNLTFTYFNGNHNALHIRQLEKYLFGADGDNNDQKEALINKLVAIIKDDLKTMNSQNLDKFKKEIFDKARDFSNKYSKVKVEDDKIKNATEKYLNTYLNAAYVRVELS
ncbi:hypothetical protein RRG53_01035 [Mycoplasmopsis cynos]|uniref:hypothetical protein n=2 Tax=Mycoplasmopsis cynos TaxID=171284 RepID=UPI002AFF5742|nr:hypothetical protein [Mycoplasmopsis cynos]WQQ18644.1 hypothetical protein RRG53_01035 [Mycoplasmopsis cynos]